MTKPGNEKSWKEWGKAWGKYSLSITSSRWLEKDSHSKQGHRKGTISETQYRVREEKH